VQTASTLQVSSGGEVTVQGATGQFLYVPVRDAQATAVQSVVVQGADGRQYAVPGGQVQAAAGGRLAIVLPAGITDGTATLTINGQVLSIPFHIVAAMTAAPVIGTLQVAGTDPRCSAIAGTWQGTIWASAGSSATAWLQILDDCRTVQGTISAASPQTGSVDATIEGTWDAGSGTLVARDTQLFNVRPVNGTEFCETTRYEMHLAGNELVGTNDTTGTTCANRAPVRLYRLH
jgi:hypothetical protein